MTRYDITMLKCAINHMRKGACIVSNIAEDAVGLEVTESVEDLVELIEAVITLNEDEVVDNVVYVAPERWGR